MKSKSNNKVLIWSVIVAMGDFLFFSVMMVVQAIVVWRYFPETKGRTLEELGQKLSGRK
jgi:hypothetical protein